MENGNVEKSSAEKVLKVLEWCFVTAAFVFAGALINSLPPYGKQSEKVPW
jgi:hypothetical protein